MSAVQITIRSSLILILMLMTPSIILLRQPTRRITIGTLVLIGAVFWAMFFWNINKRRLSEIFITPKVESAICASLPSCKSLKVHQAFSEELKQWTPVIAVQVSNYPASSTEHATSENISLLHHAIEEQGLFVRTLLRDPIIDWLKTPMPVKKARLQLRKHPSSTQQHPTPSHKETAASSTPSKDPEQIPQELQRQLY